MIALTRDAGAPRWWRLWAAGGADRGWGHRARRARRDRRPARPGRRRWRSRAVVAGSACGWCCARRGCEPWRCSLRSPRCSPRPRPGRPRRSATPPARRSPRAARPRPVVVSVGRAAPGCAGSSFGRRASRAAVRRPRAGSPRPASAPPAGFGPAAGFPGPPGPCGSAPPRAARSAGPGGGGAGGPGGGAFGGDSTALRTAIAYARAHGGGTIGVESQSSAAAAIIDQNADVAGLGGFSGRESTVSVAWLADEVASGRLRWIMTSDGAGGAPARRHPPGLDDGARRRRPGVPVGDRLGPRPACSTARGALGAIRQAAQR